MQPKSHLVSSLVKASLGGKVLLQEHPDCCKIATEYLAKHLSMQAEEEYFSPGIGLKVALPTLEKQPWNVRVVRIGGCTGGYVMARCTRWAL